MMLTERPTFKRWIYLAAVFGFAAFVFYLLFFTNFAEVGLVLSGTNVGIYILAFFSILIASAFDALAWKSTLDNLSVITNYRRIFSLRWVGHFIDTLIPGGLSGDVFMTYLLAKDKDVNGSKAAASIIIKDVLELLVVLSSLFIGLILLAVNYNVDSMIMAAISITMVLLALPLALIVYLSTNIRATQKILEIIQRFAGKLKKDESKSLAFQEKLKAQILDFREGVLSIKKNPRGIVKPIVFQTFCWIFEVLSFFLVFVALGYLIGIDKVVITNTIVSNVQGQGVALAGVSTMVSGALYEALGISSGLAWAAGLLALFASFWFKLVLSFGFFQITVFERCVPFFCKKCGGWRGWRKKTCSEDMHKKPSVSNP